ncbi:nuclear transport factor 2 family protein [Halococcus sediminicola]|uniref:nuclear transport factor 2 family protein n=1 Tax=Halococcus sediminicola TaxID=1264579 RepID=UPI0006792426|nr:nuclear transport factor 2 family protein [Halococcus sediminicola]
MEEPSPPRAVVEEFFARMETDDRRGTVSELFAPIATITLPGVSFGGENAADAFLDYLAPRYEWASKTFDRWIEADTTVVSIGTLSGVDNDGEPFEDVRYVDVYTVVDGRIEQLDIWNDLLVAEVVDS